MMYYISRFTTNLINYIYPNTCEHFKHHSCCWIKSIYLKYFSSLMLLCFDFTSVYDQDYVIVATKDYLIV